MRNEVDSLHFAMQSRSLLRSKTAMTWAVIRRRIADASGRGKQTCAQAGSLCTAAMRFVSFPPPDAPTLFIKSQWKPKPEPFLCWKTLRWVGGSRAEGVGGGQSPASGGASPCPEP